MSALRDRYCRAPETRASCDGSPHSASSAHIESAPRFRSAGCPAFTHASPLPTRREHAETARNCPRAARASAHAPTARVLACHAKPAKAPPLLVARRKRVATRSSERWVKEEELSNEREREG